MKLMIFFLIFLSALRCAEAMERGNDYGEEKKVVFPKLIEITAKKIYDYQGGNRNVKKTVKLLRSLPDSAAVHIAQQKNNNGDTLLHTAAYLGNAEIITCLLQLGVARTVRNKWRETPTVIAAKQGHIDCFELLYTHEAVMEPEDNDLIMEFLLAIPGQSALACIEKTETLYDENEMVESLCAGGDIDYLKKMINRVGIQSGSLKRGFINAIRAGALEHIEILLNHDKAYGWLGTKLGEFCALYEATLCGHFEIAQLLVERGMICNEALHCAIRTNNKKIAKFYCKKFPEQINALDELKNTPLYYAAFNGFVGLVDYLLKKGAHPNIEGENQSALYAALTTSKNYTIVKTLVDVKAQILNDGLEHNVLFSLVEDNELQLYQFIVPYCEQCGIPPLNLENDIELNSRTQVT